MREIKFRIWVESENLMVYPNKNFPIYIDNCEWDEGQIPMQYTGLKDKNGKEVFEGDILKNDYGNKRVVSWTQSYECEPCFNISYDEVKRIEVIGNTYEHKHLLNKEQ